MTDHYTTATESDTAWCSACGHRTQHHVSGHRLGRCLEHDAPHVTQRQAAARDRRERERQQPNLFPGPETSSR